MVVNQMTEIPIQRRAIPIPNDGWAFCFPIASLCRFLNMHCTEYKILLALITRSNMPVNLPIFKMTAFRATPGGKIHESTGVQKNPPLLLEPSFEAKKIISDFEMIDSEMIPGPHGKRYFRLGPGRASIEDLNSKWLKIVEEFVMAEKANFGSSFSETEPGSLRRSQLNFSWRPQKPRSADSITQRLLWQRLSLHF